MSQYLAYALVVSSVWSPRTRDCNTVLETPILQVPPGVPSPQPNPWPWVWTAAFDGEQIASCPASGVCLGCAGCRAARHSPVCGKAAPPAGFRREERPPQGASGPSPDSGALRVDDLQGGLWPLPQVWHCWGLKPCGSPAPSLSACGTLAGVYRREFLLLIQRDRKKTQQEAGPPPPHSSNPSGHKSPSLASSPPSRTHTKT